MGHSSIIDPWGKVIATTKEIYDIIYADLNFDKCDKIRRNIAIF
jgi:predicted amidohydrolase